MTLDAHEAASGSPEIAQSINDEASCTGCAKPADLKIADRILSLSDKMEAAPPMPKRKARWFDEELEEEEESEDGD